MLKDEEVGLKKGYTIFLKYSMLKQGVGMADMAREFGCTRELIRQALDGLGSSDMIKKICTILGINFEYLLGDVLGNDLEKRGKFVYENPITFPYLYTPVELTELFDCYYGTILDNMEWLGYIDIGIGGAEKRCRVRQSNVLGRLK